MATAFVPVSPVHMADLLPRLAVASAACSAIVIEFTIPQIVKLSQTSSWPLPRASLQTRLAILARAGGPQTALTCGQFMWVRQVRGLLDKAIGHNPINLSLAYGTAVPFSSAKYSMCFADVFRHFNKAAAPLPEDRPGETRVQCLRRVWQTKIRPGLFWSYLRDSGAIGGAVVLGPLVTMQLHALTSGQEAGDGGRPSEPSRPLQLVAGTLTGCCTGFATQLFHNAALTGSRMAGLGEPVSNLGCMRQLIAEQGLRAFYLNYPLRVGVIAGWGAILNVTKPFER